MGMESYTYVIDYEDNIANAIDKLQQRVFANGDYRYSENGHDSIDDARDESAEDGTGSALDIYGISSKPQPACLTVLTEDDLHALFGNSQLTVDDVDMISNNNEFWESIGRGEARLMTLCDKAGKPDKYYIGGYSFD